MIFLELLIFFISLITLSLSISGYGSLLTFNSRNNLFVDIFFGFVSISLIITILHFFFKINFLINTIIFALGLIIFYKKRNINFLILFKKKNIFYLIIILFFLPMVLSQKYHEDFGYYHLPYALAFLEEKIVFGFANIDRPFVYNSLWLNLKPIFFLENKKFDFLTLPSFLLFISFIIFSINEILKKKQIKISDYYLVVILFYFLLKFTRISEFGVDFPAIIFSVLGIYYFIKFYETNEDSKKRLFFYFNLTFSIFSILIKLSIAPIIFLTVYLYFSNLRNLKFFILNYKFLIIYFLCFVFFIQQFIYTGCFLFPTNFTCLDVSWFNIDHLNLSKQLELTNKSYSEARNIYSPEEYLSNFNWFLFWIKRNSIEIIEHLMTIILPTLMFVFFLKKEKKNILFFKKKLILYFFIILSLIFWLNFSPVYRFAIHIFATLIFIVFLNFLISRKFSKKKFIIFILIFLIFNFSKNILRIYETEKVFLGIQKIENQFILNDIISNKYVKIYYPDIKKNKKNGWQGRLCWNAPFICSYNKLDVKKKNGYLIVNKLQN
ncbi:MAG: LIC_10190 family membrane protein [Candidatus Pelagibacter sp.]